MMDRARLYASITSHEGCKLAAYQDENGVWTIGWGHTGKEVVPGLTCTQAQANAWLDSDIDTAIGSLDHFLPWWRGIGNDPRENVLAEMSFNLGITRLLGFHHMLGYAQSGDYTHAALEMDNSLWATQVGNKPGQREAVLSTMMRTGDF